MILTLGRVAAVSYVRDVSGEDAKVLRGTIGVGLAPGEFAPLPDSGVAANINLVKVDVDAWDRVLSGSAAKIATKSIAIDKEKTRPTAQFALNQPELSGSTLSYLPTKMAIRAKELHFQGRKLNNVVVGGSREGLNWRANIDAAELNGYVEFRQPSAGAGTGTGRVYARLSRLVLAPGTASEV